MKQKLRFMKKKILVVLSISSGLGTDSDDL